MNKLAQKPHLIFLFAIPLTILIGILNRDSVFDFNVNDSYFIIGHVYLAILVSILYAIVAIGYWMAQKAGLKLSDWLTWSHIGLTFGGTMLACVLTKFYRPDFREYQFNTNLTLIIWFIILLVIAGQLCLLINIIYGLLNKKNKTSE